MAKILIATDFSTGSLNSLCFAQEQLRARGDSLQLHLVTVLEDVSSALVTFEFGIAPLVSEASLVALESASRERLHALAAEYFPGVNVAVEVLRGARSVAPTIVEHVRRIGADECIIATHGRSGVSQLLMGSVAAEVVRGAVCPTFVVPARDGARSTVSTPEGAAPILVLTDFSPESTTVFPFAKEQFAAFRSRSTQMILLHLVEDLAATGYHLTLGGTAEDVWSDMESRADELMALFCAKYFPDETVDTAIIRQQASLGDEVVAFAKAKDVGLIVIGSHGRSGFRHAILGSVAERVIRGAHCPVLIVPVPAAVD